MSSGQTRGLVVGVVLGIVWAWLGFGAVLLTAGLGLVGWLAGSVLGSMATRDVSIAELWNAVQGRRAES